MALVDTQKELYERAARIEEMEGTIKYTYKTEPEDVRNYISGVNSKNIILLITMLIFFTIPIIGSVVYYKSFLLTGFLMGVIIVFAFIMLMLILKNKSTLKNIEKYIDEVEISFNAYGVVFKMSGNYSNSVCVYEWNEFDSIIEYPKVVAGMRRGVAYIFPKRVFSEEEFNRFRRFSYAAISKKCLYKNFKP